MTSGKPNIEDYYLLLVDKDPQTAYHSQCVQDQAYALHELLSRQNKQQSGLD